MKHLLTLIVFLFCINAKAYIYEEQDKNLHFGLSLVSTYALTSVIYHNSNRSAFESYLAAVTVVYVAGVIKETMIDDQADEKDIQANLTGSLVALPLLMITF